MTESPESSSGDEICPMCKKPKSKHTNEEMLACSKKMAEFEKDKTGGAGIEWIYDRKQEIITQLYNNIS